MSIKIRTFTEELGRVVVGKSLTIEKLASAVGIDVLVVVDEVVVLEVVVVVVVLVVVVVA